MFTEYSRLERTMRTVNCVLSTDVAARRIHVPPFELAKEIYRIHGFAFYSQGALRSVLIDSFLVEVV